MPRYEKFGTFLLLEEVGADCVGRIYRAAKLGPGGLEKIVFLTKISPSLAQNTPLMKTLVDELKISAGLASPNIARVYGCGKLEGAYFISWEFVEGKDLGVVFTRMGEGFPLALDQTLYIVSRILAALETAHGTRYDDHQIFHGALSPVDVLITYEGDVKIKHFNIANVLSKSATERKDAYKKIETYLSPEFLEGKAPDKRSDVYALGLIFYRLLTGEPLFAGSRDIDIRQRLESSHMMTPYQDDDRLPASICDVILKCVSSDSAKRYANVKDAKQAIDALLVAGDFSPSTFNLAFFMHTAFRSEIEAEVKAIEEERAMSFMEYVESPAATVPVPKAAAGAAVATAPAPASPPTAAQRATPARPVAAVTPAPKFMEEEAPKRKVPIVAIAAATVVLVGGGVGAYLALKPRPAPQQNGSTGAAGSSMSHEDAARLKALEKEKQEALDKNAQIAKQYEDLKRQLDAARNKEEQDKIAKQLAAKNEEIKKAQEKLQSTDAQVAAIKSQPTAESPQPVSSAPAESPSGQPTGGGGSQPAGSVSTGTGTDTGPQPTSSAAPPSTGGGGAAAPTTTVPDAAVSQVREGQLISLESADVRPKVLKSVMPIYPPMAQRTGQKGTVVVSVLVSIDGSVAEAKLKSPSGSKYGFDDAALDAARRYKFSPAMKDGKRVTVWFDLPKFAFNAH